MSNSYSIAFGGELVDGFDAEWVKARVGERFRLSGAQLEKVFAAKHVVLKKGLGEAQASVYRRELASLGLRVDVLDASGAVVPPPEPPPAAARNTAFDPIYSIVYSGGLLPGSDRDRVMADAGQRLKLGERQLNAVFSGREITLKRDLNLNEARRYYEVLCDIGMDVSCAPPLPGNPEVAPESVAAPDKGVSDVERDMMETVVWSNPEVQDQASESDDDRLVAALRAEFDPPSEPAPEPAKVEAAMAGDSAKSPAHLAQTMLNPDALRAYLGDDAEDEYHRGPVDVPPPFAAQEHAHVEAQKAIEQAASDPEAAVPEAPPAAPPKAAPIPQPEFEPPPETVMVPIDEPVPASVAPPQQKVRRPISKTTGVFMVVIAALLVTLVVVIMG